MFAAPSNVAATTEMVTPLIGVAAAAQSTFVDGDVTNGVALTSIDKVVVAPPM